MSEILGVLGVVVLFVTFGLLHRNSRSDRCQTCSHTAVGRDCSCDLIHDLSESSHG
jgi:hypothetical protein